MSSTCDWVVSTLFQPVMYLARPFLSYAGLTSSPPPAPAEAFRIDAGASLEEAFEAAAAAVSASSSLPVALKLRLYALFKQTSAGDASATPPSASVLDTASQLKWRAWAEVRGMPREEAMRLYVTAAQAALNGDVDCLKDVPALTDDAEEEIFNALNGFAGPVMSCMSAAEEEEEEPHDAHPWSALHASARRGDADQCRVLLSSGASANAVDDEGHVALHWASDQGHTAVVTLLLEAGANPAARNCDGSTPLHMAFASEHADVAAALVRFGADLHDEDDDGCTPASFTDAEFNERVRQLVEAEGDTADTAHTEGRPEHEQ